MKVLIIGNGGREHALAWKAAQSPRVTQVLVAPGNAGTAHEPKVKNIAIPALDIAALINFAKTQAIALTIVGPETPLAAGIVDQFQQHGLACFGPSKAAAQLEASKAYSKAFMLRHQIPTANSATFTDLTKAKHYLEQQTFPIVIKADGLAAGKGVIIAKTWTEAEAAVEDMLAGNSFGAAGHRVIIEEFLAGEEASFIVMADGKHVLPLATSQDHKARDDNDQGPNTGGMGAYSPAPVITPVLHKKIMRDIILPTIQGMAKDGHPYTGFLYAGLMITPNGDIKVLEYNCRLGDPETQPIMLRLKTDLIDLCQAALAQQLDKMQCQWDERAALGVVLAAGGYPNQYQQGQLIQGLDQPCLLNQKIFHAGTAMDAGKIVTAGGRVLCAAALGATVQAAQQSAYELVKHIRWENMHCRKDIGYRAINREKM